MPMVLGATHYPLDQNMKLVAFFQNRIKIFDSALVVALKAEKDTGKGKSCATTNSGENIFYVFRFNRLIRKKHALSFLGQSSI
jgi:glutamate racemase